MHDKQQSFQDAELGIWQFSLLALMPIYSPCALRIGEYVVAATAGAGQSGRHA